MKSIRHIPFVGALVSNEVLMQRFPSHLSEEDQRTYRRWIWGFYLSYLGIIVVAIALTLMLRPATELAASDEVQMARLKGSSASTGHPTAVTAAVKR
jgi:hypothetical protein